jgi:hypothetical protein
MSLRYRLQNEGYILYIAAARPANPAVATTARRVQ